MYSSSSSKEDWKDWHDPSGGDKWDTRNKNYSQGEDVRVGEHAQERFRNKAGWSNKDSYVPPGQKQIVWKDAKKEGRGAFYIQRIFRRARGR